MSVVLDHSMSQGTRNRRPGIDWDAMSPEKRHLVNKLVRENKGLVGFFCKKFIKQYTEIEYDDLESEGMLGLARAAVRYKPELGWKFSTLASTCIIHALSAVVQRYLRHTKGAKSAVRRTASYSEHPDLVRRKSKGKSLLSQLAADGDLTESREWLEFAVAGLDPRVQKILRLRFVEGMTLSEVGQVLEPSLTRERVRQIQVQALKQLSQQFKARRVREGETCLGG